MDTIIGPSLEVIPDDVVTHEITELTKSGKITPEMSFQRGCRLHGTIQLPQVPGKIVFK